MLNPYKYAEETASPLIIGSLYHIVPHLKGAARLLWDDFTDPYDQPAKST